MSSGRSEISRRAVLAGLVVGAAGTARADAPRTSLRPPLRPLGSGAAALSEAPASAKVGAAAPEDLIAAAELGGEIAYVVADARTGLVLEARQAGIPMPPASTAKAITALYALDRLGRGFRFPTRLMATGPVEAGIVAGDLILAGGGDPTLSTDHLGDMAARLGAAGVRGVSGRFLVWGGALPYLAEIDPDQPDWFGYNPSVSGINLNFNRVNFVWKRNGDGYDLAMNAEGERFVPPVYAARVSLAEREEPLFTYEADGTIEEWTVARKALGKAGSRWLPVRRPEAYAGDVFQTLARAQGVRLPSPEATAALPAGGTEIVVRTSDDLGTVLKDMLKYSTNLTAESVGMTASLVAGVAGHAGSGRAMTEWVRAKAGLTSARFVDHSGLGPSSRVTAAEMVRALVALGPGAGLRGLMKDVTFREKGEEALPAGIRVQAKTGTLNFVSALAGYMTAQDGTDMAFAILTGDVARRDAVPDSAREDPPGARAWTKRSRRLQAQLIERWAAVYGT